MEKILMVAIRPPAIGEIYPSDIASIVLNVTHDEDKMAQVNGFKEQAVCAEIDAVIIFGTNFPLGEMVNATMETIVRHLLWNIFLKHNKIPNLVFISQAHTKVLEQRLIDMEYHIGDTNPSFHKNLFGAVSVLKHLNPATGTIKDLSALIEV